MTDSSRPEPSLPADPFLEEAALHPRQGDEASWPIFDDGVAPPRGFGAWPISPPPTDKPRHPFADIAVASVLALALAAAGGLYVAGVIDRPHQHSQPRQQQPVAPTNSAPPNPFAP